MSNFNYTLFMYTANISYYLKIANCITYLLFYTDLHNKVVFLLFRQVILYTL